MRSFGIFCVAAFVTSHAFAQLEKFTDRQLFSDSVITLRFGFTPSGIEATELYSQLGVSFHADVGSPVIGTVVTAQVLPPTIEAVIRTGPDDVLSGGIPLVVTFQYPLSRVGFTLGNGEENTVVQLTAFTRDTTLLGSVQQDQISRIKGPFVGLETTHPSGISTVIIDYGDDEQPEQLNDLLVEYREAQVFKTCVAQIADGKVGEDGTLQTIIKVASFLPSTSVTAKLYDQIGSALDLEFTDGSVANNLEFRLSSRWASRTFEITGKSDPVKVGYACFESDRPVTAQTIFRTKGIISQSLSEAGVEAVVGKPVTVGFIERVILDDINSGVAIANVGTQDASIQFYLKAEGTSVGSTVLGIALPKGHQQSLFVSELFEEVGNGFKGILRIASTQPLAVTILRTVEGVAVSSLTLGSTQK